jgi:hypothetical protein
MSDEEHSSPLLPNIKTINDPNEFQDEEDETLLIKNEDHQKRF